MSSSFNYHEFFHDLEKWMDDNNQVVVKYPMSSDQYWQWVIESSSELCKKYNNHPLAISIINAIWKYQEDRYKEISK